MRREAIWEREKHYCWTWSYIYGVYVCVHNRNIWIDAAINQTNKAAQPNPADCLCLCLRVGNSKQGQLRSETHFKCNKEWFCQRPTLSAPPHIYPQQKTKYPGNGHKAQEGIRVGHNR